MGFYATKHVLGITIFRKKFYIDLVHYIFIYNIEAKKSKIFKCVRNKFLNLKRTGTKVLEIRSNKYFRYASLLKDDL